MAAQAGRETDPEKRKELYKQVEQMMIGDEVRIAPFTHDGYSTLTKPFIDHGYPTFGPAQWDRWKMKQPVGSALSITTPHNPSTVYGNGRDLRHPAEIRPSTTFASTSLMKSFSMWSKPDIGSDVRT